MHKEVYYTDAMLSFAKRFRDIILMQNSGCPISSFDKIKGLKLVNVTLSKKTKNSEKPMNRERSNCTKSITLDKHSCNQKITNGST